MALKRVALVVEDREQSFRDIETYLAQNNYTVKWVKTLKQAKQFLRSSDNSLDLLLSDLDLSKTGNPLTHKADGYKLLKWIYSHEDKGDIAPIYDIVLHSSFFEEKDDLASKLPFLREYLKRKVENMGYQVKPKSAHKLD